MKLRWLVKQYPNDGELGEVVRELIRKKDKKRPAKKKREEKNVNN